MLQLTRLVALVSVAYIALTAMGNQSVSVAFGSLTQAEACTRTPLQLAVDNVDYAEAILIANGEMYFDESEEDIQAKIAALPAYDTTDGVSYEEITALDELMMYGRQLAYIWATEELEFQLRSTPEGVQLASADDGISFDVLEKLRGG